MMGRNIEKVQHEADRLTDEGYTVFACQTDVSNGAQVREAFDRHMEQFGKLDIVFANAGTAAGKGYVDGPDGERQPDGQIDTTDLQPWEDLININLSGVYYTLRHAARIIKSQNKKGSIIVTTSNASTITVPIVAAPYMATMAGAAHLVRQIARELAEFGFR